MTGSLQHSLALKFILAGKSEFTIENLKTKNKFLYQLRQSSFNMNSYKVRSKAVRATNDNTVMSFSGTLYINPQSCRFYQGRGNADYKAQRIQALVYTIQHLRNGNLPDCVEIAHTGRCALCGRRLTDAESIKRGFGKYCWEHYINAADK